MYRKYFKRLMDIVFALIIFSGFWWVYLIVGVLVRIKLGSPVIFKQDRPGKDGKIFTLYKFRTMLDTADALGKLLPNEKRFTKFGLLLRSTSLDELPQAWNVLRGEMSFVGPRPLFIRYLSRYSKEQGRRHEVKPGITGWAQVKGRNSISWDEKFKMDVEYVNNYSFLMDLKIILLTAKKVFCREGVSPEGQIIVDEFMGNEEKE
ncbi:sugar transferase [Psychrilyobacter piezotolerans]|uniref:Sugar transferase n=1 Tax=Psychrilyobacter piezotolerans TaxID=2293438 RepID=A0ABX9KI94_9FUSO|nr:sugar transferase [Psychrilyobacter sp. S5]NDI77665.1 sugar transferase [Psychrilyobacter piezotolerans]RDE62672.1 sugar transferase [Psychrilyobacter sp. S5]REI41602.1 sugar transferase [Psychrilyobacter piezotolerans]